MSATARVSEVDTLPEQVGLVDKILVVLTSSRTGNHCRLAFHDARPTEPLRIVDYPGGKLVGQGYIGVDSAAGDGDAVARSRSAIQSVVTLIGCLRATIADVPDAF